MNDYSSKRTRKIERYVVHRFACLEKRKQKKDPHLSLIVDPVKFNSFWCSRKRLELEIGPQRNNLEIESKNNGGFEENKRGEG